MSAQALTDFANKSSFMVYGLLQRAGNNAHGHSEVSAGLGHSQSSNHVQIHVLVPERQLQALLDHGANELEPLQWKPVRGAARGHGGSAARRGCRHLGAAIH